MSGGTSEERIAELRRAILAQLATQEDTDMAAAARRRLMDDETASRAKRGLDEVEARAAQAPSVTPAPPPEPAPTPTIMVTPVLQGGVNFIVVGAGGTGARVMGPLSQMARPNDRIIVVDHDQVEERNLIRQHFIAADIGQPKALIVADRYSKPGITIHAVAEKLSYERVVPFLTHTNTIMIGCVDNHEARIAIRAVARMLSDISHKVAWIDVGNEMRGGQVLLGLYGWLGVVKGITGWPAAPSKLFMDTVPAAMPQLLRPDPSENVSCGERIDLQTVMVNHMASSAAINAVSWLLLGIAFCNAGSFFTTLNGMQPIPITDASLSNRSLVPSTAFAISA